MLSCKLSIEKINQDNPTPFKIPHQYEKSYSLVPENSIKYDNKFFIQPGGGSLTGFVEVSLSNTMRYPAFITRLQVIESKDVKKLEVYGIDLDKQEIARRSTFKFVLKYELNRDVHLVKDYGRIQFVWGAENQGVEGGILAYNVICSLEKRPDEISVDRADNIILKKFEVTQVKLTIHNM